MFSVATGVIKVFLVSFTVCIGLNKVENEVYIMALCFTIVMVYKLDAK